MADSMQVASPQTPGSARKAPSTTTTPSKSKPSKGSGAGTKRKVKTEDASPSQAKPRKKKAEKGAAAQVPPNKKQKVQKKGSGKNDDLDSGKQHLPPTLDTDGYEHIPIPIPRPSQTSSQPFQAAQPFPTNQNLRINAQLQPNASGINTDSGSTTPSTPITPGNTNIFVALLMAVLKKTPSLLPSATPLTSDQIDTITYTLWNACLTHENSAPLNLANKYGAMLSEAKVRVLACMGFLPSWWFLREQFVLPAVKRFGRAVDDTQMDGWTAEAAKQTARMMARVERRGEKGRVGEMEKENGDVEG
ncbi:hypothetical protein FB567DRAFT_575949 [Paraphoma chrysanthemicola]|uniref:Uncharacterized protein n=1 Tax=Paraphoma chrysanthemicola TaxID=798071 RepID=A0A8K0W3D5_9PLEO|nr:hypothetical protein FB567DRAFT_575949 [Paraphoma chrysanthemicola]